MFTETRITLSDLVRSLGDELSLSLHRDAEIAFVGKVPTQLDARLVPCSKPEHLSDAACRTGIAAYVVPAALVDQVPFGAGVLVSEKPVYAAMSIHEHMAAQKGLLWTDFPTEIASDVEIGPGAVIPEHNVRIGARSVIGPNAVIHERTLIGSDCFIGAGVIVGMQAFEQFVGAEPKRILKQAGGVLIEDWVSIEANTTISRATFGGFTRIGRETKIDAQVYLAHDCQLGARVTICSACSINGRVEIGDDAYLGPNCTISNGLRIGTKATVSLGSTVTRDVPDGARVSGTFALPHDNWLNFLRDYR